MMRADAIRNQARILDAARAEITEHGSDVSMEQIAKAAGVAVGTLYRHYPTKKDLVQAVLTEFIETLISWAETAAESVTPGDAMDRITQILARFLDAAATDKAVKEAANTLGAEYTTADLMDRGSAALNVLLAAAAKDGDLRDGVTVDDIFLLMMTAPSAMDAASRERWLGIVTAGLRRSG